MASKLETFIQELHSLELEDDCLLLDLAEGEPATVPVADILYVASAKRGLRVVLADERELLTRPSESLSTMGERLARHSNIVRTQNAHLVNLDHVAHVRRQSSDQHTFTFYCGKKVPVTLNQDLVLAHFGIESLDHVIPWNEQLANIIAENLRTFDKDIRFMTDEEIRANFSTQSTGELVIRQIIGNIIWQTYNWIKEGRIDPLDGNIRSFWYSHIKPVLGRFFVPLKESYYDAVTEVFTKYAGELQLFRYSEFGLVDDLNASTVIGSKYPHIIFCAEKQGHIKAIQQVAAEAGVTAIALGGQPSMLTSESLVDQLAKVTSLKQRFYLITDVDYDPSGNIIADSFKRQLHWMGADDVVRIDLIQPEAFTAEELKYFRYPVANGESEKKKVRDWMDKRKSPFGGGLPDDNGIPVPYGMESDALPRKRLHDNAIAAIQQVLAAPSSLKEAEILSRVRQHQPPFSAPPYLKT